MSDIDQSTKLFNTAIISTKIPKPSNYSLELNELVQTDAFKAILEAVKVHAKNNNLSEVSAAEDIIDAFRKVDKVWNEYIFQEGLEKLKASLGKDADTPSIKKTKPQRTEVKVQQASIF